MTKLRPERFDDLLRRFEQLEVLVVGDVMLDEYLEGDVERVSPEAPVPVVSVARESCALGGAGNVLRNLTALGARARLACVVGADDDGGRVVDLLKGLGVDASGVVVDETRRTTRKTRIVARDQQLIRADREDVHGLAGDVRVSLETTARAALRGADGVAFVDYGKGVCGGRDVSAGSGMIEIEAARSLVALAAELGVPAAVDPKAHLDGWVGVALVKPNALEAAALTGAGGPGELVDRLRERLPGADVALTLGAGGMIVAEAAREKPARTIPTARLDVYDVQGAGDTSLAALWLARLSGASLEEAAILANAASGVAVGKVGTATATPDEVRTQLPAVLDACRDRRGS